MNTKTRPAPKRRPIQPAKGVTMHTNIHEARLVAEEA
jgi:hypothetical protein